MENNQEHRIDKIFRETFENQEITPPSDAWMSIHTYTIGQEQKKPKVWLRYASLAMALLLVSGLGFWYFANNQTFDTPVAGLPTSPLVRKHTQKSILPTTGNIVANVSPPSIVHKHIPTLLTPEVDWSGDQPRDETFLSHEEVSLGNPVNTYYGGRVINHSGKSEPLIIELEDDTTMNKNEDFVEPVCYFNNFQIENIEPKPLILKDLSDKMQKDSERKIVVLEENIIDKKEGYRVDSVVYGKGFSLKHPIITFGLFGTVWNFWDFENNGIGTTFYPNERSSIVKLGIAWKVNKKVRIGFSLGTSNNNLGVPRINNQPNVNSLGGIYVKLIQINSDQYYQATTPFGGVNIPIVQFNTLPYPNPYKLDSVRLLGNGVLPHSMKTIFFAINSQFDLFSIQRKKGKHYSYQIYGLTDLNVQRQTNYFYTATESYSSSNGYGSFQYNITAEGNYLQNASEFVFGLRAGLGFRYQFARKWDFYVEGSGQHSLNNWVKSDDIKTFQRTLSLQAGINLNL
jgi:hypothetical protein